MYNRCRDGPSVGARPSHFATVAVYELTTKNVSAPGSAWRLPSQRAFAPWRDTAPHSWGGGGERAAAAAELAGLYSSPPAVPDGVSAPVRTLLESIHRNPFDPTLSVKTLKASCRLRDNNVSCRFRSETGMYLHVYIVALRMQAAARLMERSALSIADVAQLVGYGHLQTFYRVFKEYFRCTPAVFRASIEWPSHASDGASATFDPRDD